MARQIRWTLLTVLLVWAIPAWATVYWVSGSLGGSGTCGNSQGATPPANYLRTITAGMACLSAGDTLYVRSGTYTAKLRSGWVSGSSSSAKTTYARYPSDPVGSVIIRPSDAGQPYTSSPLFIPSQNNIIFDGFVVNGTDNIQASAVFAGLNVGDTEAHPQNVTISNNEIIGCSGEYGVGTEFIGNRLHGCSGYGVYWSGSNGLLERNEFYEFGGYCIHMWADAGNVNNNIIRNNICRNSGFLSYDVNLQQFSTPGVIIAKGNNIQFYNNLIYNNKAGLQIASTNVLVYQNSFSGNSNNDGNLPGCMVSGPFFSPSSTIRNNICYGNANNGIGTLGGSVTESNNLLGVNPFWVSTAGGDFHIATAGSPAINAGLTLGAPWNVDKEGSVRPPGQYTAGAYQFGGAPPQQIGNFAKWTFEQGTGTNALDSSGQNHTCVLNTVGWGTGIIGSFSLNANAVRECHVTTTTGMRPTATISGSVWLNGTPNGDYGYLVDMGGVWGLWHDPAGMLVLFINGGAQSVQTTGINLLTGTNRHVAFTKDSSGLRLWIDGSQVAFTATTTPLSYSGSEQFFIGRNALQVGNYFPGRIDQVYLFDTPLDQTLVTQLFNEYVPTAGMSVTHSRFTTANQAEGVFSAALDTDDSRLVGQPVGIRWAIHRGDAGSLTEFFRIFCRTNTGAGYGAWTEVGNSFLGLGIRFYTDPAIALGQATSALLPLEGATATPGLFLENPVDTTAPYDAGQRLTIALGQHAELEARLELGAPLVATNTVQCRPQRENASVFESYGGTGDPAIRTLTLAVPNVARALMGVQVIGGSVQ